MPLAIVLELQTHDPTERWPTRIARLLQGWVYDEVLAAASPVLAAGIHEWRGLGPITLAALPGPPGGRLAVRLTVVDEPVAEAVLAQLSRIIEDDETVTLGAVSGSVDAISGDGRYADLAGWSSYPELLDTAPEASWAFRFVTPTTFRTTDVDLPLPLPRSLWRAWLDRWNRHAPAPARYDPAFLDLFDRHVAFTDLRLESRLAPTSPKPTLGFVGQIALRAAGRPPAEMLHTMTVLARYAFWAGTGRQTMLGMGVTKWLNDRS